MLPRIVTEAEWNAARRREREDATHPCGHFAPDRCDCHGACTCHWHHADFDFMRSIKECVRDALGEEIEVVDFKADPAGATALIARKHHED